MRFQTRAEAPRLIERLRRQADDLVLVLPAKLRSQPWLEAAQIKLLGWDLLTRSASDTEKGIAELERNSANTEFVDAVVERNVHLGVESIRKDSEVLRQLELFAPKAALEMAAVRLSRAKTSL